MTFPATTDAWCVEVADADREQLEAAFAAAPDLRPRLFEGELHDHLDELAGAEVLSVFIASRVDRAALDRLPALKLVATRSTGVDHVDVEACRERGIAVTNVPTYGENTVAEHTWALLLALSRRLLAAEREGRVGRLGRAGLQGIDLKGRTIGVVGAGRIGLHVIRMARAFDMRVLAFDPAPNDVLAAVLGFEYVGLDELLTGSDVISLHAPASPATRHLIDADALAKVRPGALLLNTARGDLVDTAAVLAALDSGRLGGAGLDVVEGEHDVSEDFALLGDAPPDALKTAMARRLLADRDDVILTPHNAFNSVEAVRRIADTTVAAIAAHQEGRPVPNRVA